MSSSLKVIIIGGVAGGMSAATRLRRLREDAQITVYEMGEHVSYANCGLPYYLSDVIADRNALLLQTPTSLHNRFNLDVRVRTEVTKINRDDKTVNVTNLQTGEEYVDHYDKLIISTGAKPRKLPIPGINRAMTLRNVTDADTVKAMIERSGKGPAVILGAGFIGIELAENLAHIGVPTTIVQRGSSILSLFDTEMIQPLQERLRANGVQIVTNAEPVEITADAVILRDGRSLPAQIVFAAAGVVPDNSLAREAGLKMGDTGGVWVDDQQRTSDPDIYAAGDAVEKPGYLTGAQSLIPLANLANRHGRLAADSIAGLEPKAHAALGTVIIGAFGFATAITGLSERAAKKAGIKYQAIHLHPSSHAGYYPGAKRVSLKVLFDPSTGKLLGAQGNGEDGVDKHIDVIATAIHGGLTVDDLMDLELAYAPQFGSAKDAINQAGYVGNNVLHGTTETVQWHELEAEMAKGAVLVDVRTETENSAGSIPGAVNISVDELRARRDEISPENVIVHCQVGQRGHTATQILKAHGFNVRNLDGGYITWKAGVDGSKNV